MRSRHSPSCAPGKTPSNETPDGAAQYDIAIDGREWAAYHRRNFAPTREAHLRLHPLIIIAVAALAGCATPIAPPAPPPVPIVALPPPAPLSYGPPKIVIAPMPFPESDLAGLEPLPTPAGDLWDRIVRGYAIPDLEGPLVDKWERFYAVRPEYVSRIVERSRRYLYHIVRNVEGRDMPLEIALLPMVESAFNPNALSVSRASGIWQFMPSTGQYFGLKQNWWFDARRDVLAATTSALDYLEKLHDEFDDWHLALAAYNWGEGNVRRAIARNRAQGLPTDLYSLRNVPAETLNYVPKLQAIKNIIADPLSFNLTLGDLPDAPYFAVVHMTRKMDVKLAAEMAELNMDDFLALNPQHNRPVIAGADEYAILLPIDNAEVFAAKLDLTNQPLVSWQAYRLKQGETLPQIAGRYGMSVETLMSVNGIGSRAKVPTGHTLLVPSQRPNAASAESLSQAVFTSVPAGRTIYHLVRRGDTLTVIAARYGVTSQEVRQWNGLVQNQVTVGQRLRIVSDVGASTKVRAKVRRAVMVKPANARSAGAAPQPTKAVTPAQPAMKSKTGTPTASAVRGTGG
jgi:membrane-bound lytic murein transglycosylase D